jgi:hypothetical protein
MAGSAASTYFYKYCILLNALLFDLVVKLLTQTVCFIVFAFEGSFWQFTILREGSKYEILLSVIFICTFQRSQN